MKKIILILSVFIAIFNINNSYADNVQFDNTHKTLDFNIGYSKSKTKASIGGYFSYFPVPVFAPLGVGGGEIFWTPLPNAGVNIAKQYDFNNYFSVEAGYNLSIPNAFALGHSIANRDVEGVEASMLSGAYGSLDYTFGTNKSNFRKYIGVHVNPVLPGIHVGTDYYFNNKNFINVNLSGDWLVIPVASVSYGIKF